MPLRLRVLPSPAPGGPQGDRSPDQTLDFSDDVAEIRIGRRPDLELPLPDRALSALHARLVRAGDSWQIEDLGSTNGTRVDGERLPARSTRPLARGAKITVGQISFLFEGAVAAVPGGEGTTSIARRLVSDLFAASPGMSTPTLTIVSGVEARPALRLEALDRRYVVGRVETCDLPLASEEVSREHAEVVRLWDRIVIRDLESKNGVRVNGALLTEPRRLRDGDRIQIGPAVLRLSDPAERYLRDFEAATEETQDDEEPPTATEPLAAPEAAGGLSGGGGVAAALPARWASGSRLAIIVAAAVLLIVGAVIVTVAVGS